MNGANSLPLRQKEVGIGSARSCALWQSIDKIGLEFGSVHSARLSELAVIDRFREKESTVGKGTNHVDVIVW